MANTNIEIKALKDIKHFNQRKYENNRKSNIKSCEYESFMNIVEIVDPKIGLQKKPIEEEQQLKRSDITRLISAYSAKVKKCENDLSILKDNLSNCFVEKQKDKIISKIQNKENSLKSFNEKLKDFNFLKKQTPSKKVNQKLNNRNEFYELRFSITKAPKKLKRNQEYAKDLLQVVKDYIKDLKLDIDIHSFSVHMDQHSPHVHVLGTIDGKELTLNQQLEKLFDKRFSFHSLQKDFNNFAKEHQLIKKYDLKLGDIVRGGMYEYEKNLYKYKENTKNVEQQVEKQISSLKATRNIVGLVVESREQKMENILKPLLVEKQLHKKYSKNIEKDLVRSDKIVSQVLKEKETGANQLMETIIDLNDKNKDLVQKLNTKDKEIDNIVKDKLSKYQNQINNTFNAQNKKIKEYESYIHQLETKISQIEDIDSIGGNR